MVEEKSEKKESLSLPKFKQKMEKKLEKKDKPMVIR